MSLYTQRPGWYDPIPEAVAPGQSPLTFAQLKADIDNLGAAAKVVSANWGVQLTTLEELEKKRADRQKKYAERLIWCQTGNPNDNPTKDMFRGGNGFYEPVYEKTTGLLDLTTLGAPIKGSDDKPLKGSDRLLDKFNADVEKVIGLDKQIAELRLGAFDKDGILTKKGYKQVSEEILVAEVRLLKMGEIRESVQAENFYLDTFEVNVFETRQTVFRRKKQLVDRLAELK